MQATANQTEDYGHALELMQYEIQRLWIIFGTFLLAETVFLGALASAFKDAPAVLIVGGALFGLLLVVPWWTAFEYCRAFYLLRIEQAKRHETPDGLLSQGALLSKGKQVGTVQICAFVAYLRIQRGAWFLMSLFGIPFAGIATLKLIPGN